MIDVLLFGVVNGQMLSYAKQKRALLGSLVAFLVVGLFSPAIYGFSVGFFYYLVLPILLFDQGAYEIFYFNVLLQKR